MHTVYLPADVAHPAICAEWGTEALALLETVVPDAASAARVTGDRGIDADVHRRVAAKLAAQPVEDLRLDFEDGYGERPDDEEDRDAAAAGAHLSSLLGTAGGPSFAGIRFKSLESPTRRRGLRTLDVVLSTLLGFGPLPDGFTLTLPKVTSVDQVAAMIRIGEELERVHELPTGRLQFEIQVETAQAVMAADGTATVARMVHLAGPRCSGLHYGTFDYSAGLGVAAAYQSLEHPVADHAKAVMQVAAAGSGVRLSDGSTNVLPVGSPDEVRAAMRLHARLVRRSLERGFYQGWDMHPGHLVTRYLATYAFYREGLGPSLARLQRYLARGAGGVMDEPATAQALAAFVTRGLHCGALDEEDLVLPDGTALARARLDALVARRGIPVSQ